MNFNVVRRDVANEKTSIFLKSMFSKLDGRQNVDYSA